MICKYCGLEGVYSFTTPTDMFCLHCGCDNSTPDPKDQRVNWEAVIDDYGDWSVVAPSVRNPEMTDTVFDLWHLDEETHDRYHTEHQEEGKAEKIARFIADAWNISQETGLSPTELAKENVSLKDTLRQWFGCPSCGEDHPIGADCPPHEARTTGQAWFHERLRVARERIDALGAEVDRFKIKSKADADAAVQDYQIGLIEMARKLCWRTYAHTNTSLIKSDLERHIKELQTENKRLCRERSGACQQADALEAENAHIREDSDGAVKQFAEMSEAHYKKLSDALADNARLREELAKKNG